MIHGIAVPGGEGLPARIAQRHAIQMALLFRARLRVVVTGDADDSEKAFADGAPEDRLQSRIDEGMERVSRDRTPHEKGARDAPEIHRR